MATSCTTRQEPIQTYLVTSVADSVGNRIVHSYDSDGPRNQTYLRQVDYAEVTTNAAAGGWLYSIRLEYDNEERPDSFSTFRSGFRSLSSVCRRVSMGIG